MDSSGKPTNYSGDTPGTPPRPPYSPVTPVLSQSRPAYSIPSLDSIIPPSSTADTGGSVTAGVSDNGSRSVKVETSPPLPPHYMPEPSPIPISESDNPDAIALRSAISILQMQKQQAIQDIQTLDRMKQVASKDPEGFTKELLAGSLVSKEGDILHPTAPEDGDSDAEQKTGVEDRESMDVDDTETSSSSQTGQRKIDRFGKIPNPQNIVRMPPINWAKYHIVGEPLDRLHEEQRRRPTPGEPRRDSPVASRPPEHFIAAPYRPFVDKVEPRMKTRNSNKRPDEQA